MKVTVIDGREIATGLSRRWSDLQSSNNLFESPYFSPQFTAAAAAVRDNVRVGVIEQTGRVEGFFPFQLDTPRMAVPVGTKLSDCQGVIVSADLEWRVEDLLDGCHLQSWEFNHLLAAQPQFVYYHRSRSRSPLVDLSLGFENWTRSVDERSRVLKKLRTASRHLERDCGPLRFEPHVCSGEMLHRMLACKSAQYVRTGRPDRLKIPWIEQLLGCIHATQDPEFSGMLSVLYAGSRPVAFHLGMRSHRILHYWFPCYDPCYARYSPGLLLLIELIRYAAATGLAGIDLGKGESPYKHKLMNSEITLAEGRVEIGNAGASADPVLAVGFS
jgi:CelD/BcsL family acetyltransferase involved in cellulose biosynthesis